MTSEFEEILEDPNALEVPSTPGRWWSKRLISSKRTHNGETYFRKPISPPTRDEYYLVDNTMAAMVHGIIDGYRDEA